MEALEHFELDLVVAGLDNKTPWRKSVGITSPYYEEHVMATPPGEKGWLKRVEEFLHDHGSQTINLLQQESAQR